MTTSTKKSPIGWIIGGLVVVALGITLLISYSSAVAFGVQQEEGIKATYANNKNILANYTTRIGEMAQIPEMARDDLSTVMEAAFAGRYGENGSQAAVQLIVEAYPGQIDPQLYRNIQTAMEAGRIEFRDNQSKLIDQKRVYTQNLSYVFRGTWLKLAGYPKINLDEFKVISSTQADQSFDSGIDNGVQLRRPAPAAQPDPAQ